MKVPESMWKYVAIGAVAALTGGAGSSLLGEDPSAAAEAVQEEMDKRSDYQSRVHMAIQDDVEDLEAANIANGERLVRIEVLLERVLDDLEKHHES